MRISAKNQSLTMPKPKIKNDEAEHIAFVISPIGDPDSPERKRADQILNHVIEPIVSEFGYKAVRSDKIDKPGIITSQIVNHIINDPLVVADLTERNPNVFYELAIRHAIRKPVIQLIRKGERIPFDVSTQRTIQIDHKDLDSVDEAKKELRKQIKAVVEDPTLVDSPLSVAVDLQFLKRSGDPESKAIAELREILQDLSHMTREIYARNIEPPRYAKRERVIRRDRFIVEFGDSSERMRAYFSELEDAIDYIRNRRLLIDSIHPRSDGILIFNTKEEQKEKSTRTRKPREREKK